jgi:hypothetical protein
MVVTNFGPLGQANDIYTDGDTLYAAMDSALCVYDVADRANPILTDSYRTQGSPQAVRKQDDVVYVADSTSLMILGHPAPSFVAPRSAKPSEFSLAQNYPNPFNGATTLSYRLDRAGPVELTVFDLLGRRSATLMSGMQAAGEHRVIWNAGDFASGMYFAKLSAGQNTRTVKMILLK